MANVVKQRRNANALAPDPIPMEAAPKNVIKKKKPTQPVNALAGLMQ